VRKDQNGVGQPFRRSGSIDKLLRNVFTDDFPAGHSTRMPLIDAIKRVASENTGHHDRQQVRKYRSRILKPYEKRPYYPSGGIVPGETTDDARMVARLLLPLVEKFHPVPDEMKRRVVGILDDLDSKQVDDAVRELRKVSVGQILQNYASRPESPLAQPVIPSPRLVTRADNQNPEIVWVREDGTEYRDRQIGKWRLKEGHAKVFRDRPHCPISWIVPPLLDDSDSISIKQLAFVCLRQQVWLEAIEALRAELKKCGGLLAYEVLPPSKRATPLNQPPSSINPAIYKRQLQQWSHFGKIVVVQFGAEGVGPCKVVREEWDKNLASDDRFVIFHLNVDKCVGLAISFAIRAVPTIMIYKGAHLIYREAGAIDSREVRRLVAIKEVGRA
jgi:thioredoxin 1